MLFDKLCGIIERHAPQYRKYLEEARIFHFEEDFGSITAPSDPYEKFFLPFRTVAVESSYDYSVKIYSDHVKDQVGLTEYRTFIDCGYIPSHNIYTLTKGIIGSIQGVQAKRHLKIRFDFAIICNKDRILRDLRMFPDKWSGDVEEDAKYNVMLGITRLIYVNTVHRFVLEEASIKASTKKSKKIPRSIERPIYTLLTPDQIRRKLGLADRVHQGGTKTPHERRRHMRILRSDKFVNKKGQALIIPATWIGDREKIIGNKRYIVRTDL